MPSFGLKHKVGVAVLAAALFALSAGAASANEAWVWACHGPNGGVVATTMGQESDKGAEAAVNCAGPDNVGGTLKLNANPVAGSHAGFNIALPGGVKVSKILISQTAHGSATGARYVVSLSGQTLLDESLATTPANLQQSFDVNASGNLTLSLNLSCGAGCAPGAEPASVDVVKVGILVDDTTAAYGISRNANSPVNQSATMYANAVEEGVGFSRAELVVATAANGAPVFSKTETIGNCIDLTPGDPTLDLPLSSDCTRGSVDKAVAFATSSFNEGIYYWSMRVYDAVGNMVTLRSSGQEFEPFEVWHPVLGSPTQTLSIGSSAIPEAPPQTNPSPKPGVKPGSTAAACSSPRLSVSLGQKPVRVHKSTAVLKYGKRYRFEGRLTCVVNKRRISAPKRTKVELLNKVGKKTVTKTGPRIGSKGRFKISLKYPRGSRTLIFRFRNADGQRSQVSIKIKVEKKKKSAKKR
jgi:hypothetical protein